MFIGELGRGLNPKAPASLAFRKVAENLVEDKFARRGIEPVERKKSFLDWILKSYHFTLHARYREA
ncbi:MAG: hypothetical protein ACXQTD_04225 [Candidatus Syntropharchaeia archaeon]